MAWLVGAVPGLVSVGALLLVLRGWNMLHSDPAEALDLDEVSLLKKAESQASAGPLTRMSRVLLPSIRSGLPSGAVKWLQRQVDALGRPEGVTVDTVLAGILRWQLIGFPLVVVELLQGNILYAVAIPPLLAFLPVAKLTGDVKRRREKIDDDLPGFLDVLAVTVSAGIGFRRALGTVAERFGGPLGDEVNLTLHQIDNGASVRGAFMALRRRTGSQQVEQFVTAYVQAEELGSPLAETLNHIAREMRRSAAQHARQHASRVEPRVSLVTTTVMVPGTIVLLLAGMLLGTGMLASLAHLMGR